MRRRRHAKILATLGPKTSSPEAVETLWEAGADVFRINMSHGGREDHRGRVKAIRTVERKIQRPIGILADLQGPKFRIGTFAEGPVELADGAAFRLDLDETPGDATRVPLLHPDMLAALEPGNDLLLDDGKVRLTVQKTGKDFIETVVATGGPLSDRKGVNVPGIALPVSALTDKDRRDLTFALELGCDWIALSFVQRPDDIAELRKLTSNRASIVAKIEKPAALDHFEAIVELTDAVMVARGDLGVEIPPEDVPSIQKHMVGVCRQAGKPVIVATQMLDSMVDSPAPTRAEASDVAGAVYEGADAVMLSAETAVGRYPREAVAIMDRIIRRTERDPTWRLLMDAGRAPPHATAAGAITAAARQVAETIGAAAVVTYTSSGSTALRAARERPSAPILCLTGSDQTARKLTLAWGIDSFFSHDAHSVEEMVDYALAMVKENEFAERGQPIVITAGMPFGTPGATNMLRIAWVG
jgi:pyruvate kinase